MYLRLPRLRGAGVMKCPHCNEVLVVWLWYLAVSGDWFPCADDGPDPWFITDGRRDEKWVAVCRACGEPVS